MQPKAFIRIGPKGIARAREFQELLAGFKSSMGENYTGLSVPDRFFKGHIGEQAVTRWAEENDLDCISLSKNDDKTDLGDHEWPATGTISNVKNSWSQRPTDLLVPTAQAKKHMSDWDVLIAASSRWEGKDSILVTLYGVIPFQQFLRQCTRKMLLCDTLAFNHAGLPFSMAAFGQYLHMSTETPHGVSLG